MKTLKLVEMIRISLVVLKSYLLHTYILHTISFHKKKQRAIKYSKKLGRWIKRPVTAYTSTFRATLLRLCEVKNI